MQPCGAHSKVARDAMRGTAKQRGYDQDWKRLRRVVLAEEPLCRECGRRGRLTLANEVDHITTIVQRPDLRLERSNLQPLCKPCHSAKTMRESVNHCK